jgi:hypothetical protein
MDHLMNLNTLLQLPDLSTHLPEEELRFNRPLSIGAFNLPQLKTKLQALKISGKIPLGKYAEELMGVYFSCHPDYKVLASHLQLRMGNTTLGEIDFLLEHKPSGNFYHLEFALKFYLLLATPSGGKDYVGPNGFDRLHRKLYKMRERQLPLSEAYSYLLPRNVQEVELQPKLLMKGLIYEEKAKGTALKDKFYQRLSDFKEKALKECEFVLKKHKLQWLVPLSEWNEPLNFTEVCYMLDNYLINEKSVMLVIRQGTCFFSGFIVRDSWPD